MRRNDRIMGFLAPIASATLGLRRAHHGLRLLGLTMVIWAIEAGVWMACAAGVGFGMTPIEGLYIVALASIFAMIPSGPAYAGTQDAAAIIGIKTLMNLIAAGPIVTTQIAGKMQKTSGNTILTPVLAAASSAR